MSTNVLSKILISIVCIPSWVAEKEVNLKSPVSVGQNKFDTSDAL